MHPGTSRRAAPLRSRGKMWDIASKRKRASMSQWSLCMFLFSPLHGAALANSARRAVFAIHLILAVYSMLFSPPYDSSDDEKSISSSTGKGRASSIPTEREWEMVRIPDTPGTVGGIKSPMFPMTPRTKAFNDLDGGYTAGGGQTLQPWKMQRTEKMPWSGR
jgi:hypothetical protein